MLKIIFHCQTLKGFLIYVPIAELVESYRQEGKSWKYFILFFEGEKGICRFNC